MRTSPNRLMGIAFGALFVLLGFLGFVTPAGGLLLGVFEVNALQNIVHIVLGSALLLAALSNAKASSTINSVVGAIFLVLGLAGLFLVDSQVNVLALTVPGNVLRFASAAALLAVGLGAERSPAAP